MNAKVCLIQLKLNKDIKDSLDKVRSLQKEHHGQTYHTEAEFLRHFLEYGIRCFNKDVGFNL